MRVDITVVGVVTAFMTLPTQIFTQCDETVGTIAQTFKVVFINHNLKSKCCPYRNLDSMALMKITPACQVSCNILAELHAG